MMLLPALLVLVQPAPAASPIQVRVGIVTQAREVMIGLEGGGTLTDRQGRTLCTLAPEEKLRIWWDAKAVSEVSEEYRIQVGPAVPESEAEALVARLKALGLDAERVAMSDGDNWRVLAGHFPQAAAAASQVERLQQEGIRELWVASEKRGVSLQEGRALYAITDRYERIPLPREGVRLQPKGGLHLIQGKGRYRGDMDIFPNAQGRLTVVNTVDLETYLRGVVPREMGPGPYPALEALKAQAVAARTYAVANLGKRSREGYDLVDTVADQVYGGQEGETAMTDQAVRETSGLVATWQGRPIQALFMATGGGATIDNRFVFQGVQPYLQGVSSYLPQPTTLAFQGRPAPSGNQTWLTPEILALAATGCLPPADLQDSAMQRPLAAADLLPVVQSLCRRLDLPEPPASQATGADTLLWVARCLGFGPVPEGQTRPQDADYFLGAAEVPAADRLLAAFLVRRGHLSPFEWKRGPLDRARGLQCLGRLWAELEEVTFAEGTLERDGRVRPKGRDAVPLQLAENPLTVLDVQGSLRLVDRLTPQIGDRLRWMPGAPSPILVRRLDPDGAALDRYNPMAHWRQSLTEEELQERLADRLSLGPLARFTAQRNDQGRVTELKVTDTRGRTRTLSGMRIRGLLGLKDNVFNWVETGTAPHRRWTFFGRGWGHGVGMDQTGAYGLALEGRTFQEILAHYYRGSQLTPIQDVRR